MEDHRPPPAVLRLVNPVLDRVLRSRFHRPVSKYLMLLEVTGRTTGRRYRVPVGRHQDGGNLVVSVSGSWRYNLTDGAVSVIIDGRARTGVMEVVRDSEDVAAAFKMLCDRYGSKKAGPRIWRRSFSPRQRRHLDTIRVVGKPAPGCVS